MKVLNICVKVACGKNSLAVVLFCAFAAMTGASGQCSNNTSWAEFHRHDMIRFNPCETVLKVSNVADLGMKWSFTVSKLFIVYSSPAVMDGYLFVGSTANNNGLYAVNANTGAKLFGISRRATASSHRPPLLVGSFISVPRITRKSMHLTQKPVPRCGPSARESMGEQFSNGGGRCSLYRIA